MAAKLHILLCFKLFMRLLMWHAMIAHAEPKNQSSDTPDDAGTRVSDAAGDAPQEAQASASALETMNSLAPDVQEPMRNLLQIMVRMLILLARKDTSPQPCNRKAPKA